MTSSHCGGVSGDAGVWETKLFVPHTISDKDVSQKEDKWRRGRRRAVISYSSLEFIAFTKGRLRGPDLMTLRLI